MVKYFIVIAHPEPKSICQAIGNTAIEALEAAGHEVKVTRLYEENFDALSTRKNYKEVKDAAHFKPPIEDAHATATNTFVIAHPEPKSICQAIGNTAIEALEAAGHEVKVTRLYEQNFDALSTRKNYKEVKDAAHFKPPIEDAHATATNTFADDVEAEIQKLEWCDVLVFQFPLYWFSLPAVLKGWVDRVFAFSRTYSYAQMYTTGVFKGKRAILSFTTGGPGAMYTPDGFSGDINGILRPIHR
ncbi:NADH quinone oxidoreductase, putative, partial [Bodo saltans]